MYYISPLNNKQTVNYSSVWCNSSFGDTCDVQNTSNDNSWRSTIILYFYRNTLFHVYTLRRLWMQVCCEQRAHCILKQLMLSELRNMHLKMKQLAQYYAANCNRWWIIKCINYSPLTFTLCVAWDECFQHHTWYGWNTNTVLLQPFHTLIL